MVISTEMSKKLLESRI